MGALMDMFSVSADSLAAELTRYNEAYRAGKPMVSDAVYDKLAEQLRGIDPSHPYLHHVEPEASDTFGKAPKVRHPLPMLSTEKAYSAEEVSRFVRRMEQLAEEMGIPSSELTYRVTGKLDGMAGRDDGQVLATRGDGRQGFDVSLNFDRGLVAVGGRGQGLGEIVVHLPYFDTYLADTFEHSRNFVTGAIGADELNADAERAFEAGAVRFVPYSQIYKVEVDGQELVSRLNEIEAEIIANTDYLLDGVVIDVTDARIREAAGATSHHWKYQIAKKTKGEFATTTIEGLRWQTGRTGNVTPVIECTPVKVSGATISNITAHHGGMVKKLGIGIGATIELSRSGEVIPKLERVIEPASTVIIPSHCPSCGSELEWENDFLRCTGDACDAQVASRILHFFTIMGNADLFGPKTVDVLVANGITTLEQIYATTEQQFMAMGFGPGQSANLVRELSRSQKEMVEDWRFLAAQGIHHLGRGDSRRLFRHFTLEQLDGIGADQIASIHGFGAKTSPEIAEGLAKRLPTIKHLLALGFNLSRSPLESGKITDSPVSGKGIVFTGTMMRGSRDEMEAQARALGAVVQSAPSGKTAYLVAGQKVGASKIAKAEKYGTTVLSEDEYLALIGV